MVHDKLLEADILYDAKLTVAIFLATVEIY